MRFQTGRGSSRHLSVRRSSVNIKDRSSPLGYPGISNPMSRKVCFITLILVFAGAAQAQPPASSSPSPPSSRAQTPLAQTQTATSFDLSEYGVSLQPDARLIIMMAALDAAGFDLTPTGNGSAP